MEYLLCIPSRETNTRENCEKIHNVLARMSDTYKLRIVPEPVKNKQFPCPPYYKKYKIYKQVKERDVNGEAYLEKEEEDMILGSCKTEEEQELMKNCIFAYQYSSSLVLKSFREKEKKSKMQSRQVSDKNQDSEGIDEAGGTDGSAPILKNGKKVKEDISGDFDTREQDAKEGASRERESYESIVRERENRENVDRERRNREKVVRDRDTKERTGRERGGRDRAVRRRDFRENSGRERIGLERDSRENSSRERTGLERDSGENAGRERTFRERDSQAKASQERKAQKQDVKPQTQNKYSQDKHDQDKHSEEYIDGQSTEKAALEFHTHAETGSLPDFREKVQLTAAQPLQRKKESYKPLERKPALQSQSHEA